jgi:hypothetical protein
MAKPNTQPFRPQDHLGTPIVAGQFRLGDRVRLCTNGVAGVVDTIYANASGNDTLVRVKWDGETWGDKTLPVTFTTVPLDELCPEEESDGEPSNV